MKLLNKIWEAIRVYEGRFEDSEAIPEATLIIHPKDVYKILEEYPNNWFYVDTQQKKILGFPYEERFLEEGDFYITSKTETMKKIIEKIDPCEEHLKFLDKFNTFEEAWGSCQRGDWMLYEAFKLEIDERKFCLAKALCCNTVRHLMKDKRRCDAIDAEIAYGKGEISKEEMKKYATAAHAAYAAYAAYVTYDTCAVYAADATTSRAAAAYAAYSAYVTARIKTQKQTSDICREVLTEDVFNIINKL